MKSPPYDSFKNFYTARRFSSRCFLYGFAPFVVLPRGSSRRRPLRDCANTANKKATQKGVQIRERDAVRSFDFGCVGVQMYGRSRNRTKAKQARAEIPFSLVLLHFEKISAYTHIFSRTFRKTGDFSRKNPCRSRGRKIPELHARKELFFAVFSEPPYFFANTQKILKKKHHGS